MTFGRGVAAADLESCAIGCCTIVGRGWDLGVGRLCREAGLGAAIGATI